MFNLLYKNNKFEDFKLSTNFFLFFKYRKKNVYKHCLTILLVKMYNNKIINDYF